MINIEELNDFNPLESCCLPDSFWKLSKILTEIRNLCRERQATADVVLHCLLAKLSSLLPANLWIGYGGETLPTNYFTCVISPTGDGKSYALTITDKLAPSDEWLSVHLYADNFSPSSGQGIVDKFLIDRTKKVPDPDDPSKMMKITIKERLLDNMMVVFPEGSTFGKMRGSSSILDEVLRSAFSGEKIGQHGATKGLSRQIEKNSYKMGVVLLIQPKLAGFVFDDMAGGLPGRFTWSISRELSCPESERAATLERAKELAKSDTPITPLDLSATHLAIATAKEYHNGDQHGKIIQIEPEIIDRIVEYRDKRRFGDIQESDVDGQKLMLTLRIGCLIALLHGRNVITKEDMKMTNIIWKTSCNARNYTANWLDMKEKQGNDAVDTRDIRKAVKIPEVTERNEAMKIDDCITAGIKLLEVHKGEIKLRSTGGFNQALRGRGNADFIKKVIMEAEDRELFYATWDAESPMVVLGRRRALRIVE